MGLCAQKNQYFRTGMGPLRASDDFPNALLADDIKIQQLVTFQDHMVSEWHS